MGRTGLNAQEKLSALLDDLVALYERMESESTAPTKSGRRTGRRSPAFNGLALPHDLY
jgi:hypothetical protein